MKKNINKEKTVATKEVKEAVKENIEENTDEIAKKPEKTEANKKRGMFFRGFVSVFLCVLIFIFVAGGVFYYRMLSCISETRDYAADILEATECIYNDELLEAKLLSDYDIEINAKIASVVASVLKKTEMTENTISALSSKIDDGSLYIYMDDGTVLKGEDSGGQIGSSLLDELKTNRNISKNGRIYSAVKLEGGWLVLSRKSAEDFGIKLNLPLSEKSSESIQILDKKTGLILDSNYNRLIGTYFSDWKIKEGVELKEFVEDEEDNKLGICSLVDGKWYFYVRKEVNEDIDIIVNIPTGSVIADMIGNTLLQILMTLIVFVIVVYHALFMLKNIKDGNRERRGKKIIGKLCINTNQVSHLLAFLAFGVIISILLTVYIQLLQGYSNQNQRADNSLKNVETTVTANEEVKKLIDEHFIDAYYCLGDIISMIYEMYPEKMTNEELADIASICGIKNITIYDNVGCSVAASNGYVGYVLTREEGDLESAGWQVLDSSIDRIYRNDDAGNTCFVASKCQGQYAAISLSFDSSELKKHRDFLGVDNMIKRCNFGESYVIYADINKPSDTMKMLDADGDAVDSEETIKLSESLLTGEYSGNIITGGTGYYVNEILVGEELFICAVKDRIIFEGAISGINVEIIGFIILLIVLLCCTCLYIGLPDKNISKGFNRETLMDEIINESFRKSIKAFLYGTGIVLIVVAVMEIFVFSNSTMKYLIGSEWEHKFNLFSVTMIIVAIVSANLISVILRKIVTLIGDNLGARASTISHMICSLIKFGAMAAVILFSCVQLGASLTYIMTGAGFAGIVIGYAGQGIINDLLSGLFIVFEGNIQVGDWIAVEGWSGQVQEIGVRTTKIAKGGDTRVLNNSILSNVIVWSQRMSGAICLVDIAYEEDVDEVIKLINDNAQLYKDEDKHITDGPVVHGVTDLGSSGVTIRIGAGVDDELYATAVERNIRRITKKLFDQNDISIPFPQVVVNQPKQKKRKSE